MTEPMWFSIGVAVRCSDGQCGHLARVVVDPVARTVTHLVVEPRKELGRLVPIDLVETSSDEVHLQCTEGEFLELPLADTTHFEPHSRSHLGYRAEQIFMWPHYRLGFAMEGMGGHGSQPILYDKVPVGEVEVRRGEQVHATDGWIGSVRGLVVDPTDHHATHVLLDEGHLFGHKEVAIPISDVTAVDNSGIRLGLTKESVQALPPVALDDSTDAA
jgi:hypothetical protein